jgi:hypothetical protein
MYVSKPQSLRNIPPDATRYAEQISVRTGLSMSDVFRLCLLSGSLVELTKVASDADGNYGEIDALVLARTLRRHLASAIDFLLEHGQHPYQGMLQGELETRASLLSLSSHKTTEQRETTETAFDHALGDDLELLGMGFGLSETTEA